MYLTIIFLPLIGSICAGFFGFLIGAQGAAAITIGCIFLCFSLSLFAFYEVALAGSPVYIETFD
jgi:NADH:ubiquinone oxidoreductase subunit 5 (subunit L)/multisubunit Na+/H+ antiporter MnhA subunit